MYSPQACPIGQWAPEGSMTKDQCICYPGFGGGYLGEWVCVIGDSCGVHDISTQKGTLISPHT